MSPNANHSEGHAASALTVYADRLGHEAIDMLPAINRTLAETRGCPQLLIERFAPIFGEMRERVLENSAEIDIETARKLLNVVDQVVGSIERHAQVCGDCTGRAKDELPNIDQLLQLLAKLGDIPSCRGSHYTYWWALYGGQQLTHMGTPGEIVFGNAVRGLDADQRQNALVTLAPIVNGDLAITDDEAIDRLRAAAEVEDGIRDRMLFLWKRNDSGERNLPVRVFTVEMRTFLVGYRVDGELRSGPNAADVAGQVLYDLHLGIYDDDYKTDVVPDRLARMDSLDQVLVQRAMSLDHSILTRVLDAISITSAELASYSSQMSARYLEQLPQRTAEMLEAFVALATAGGKIWGTHQSQINTYLDKAEREVPAEDLENLPMPPIVGTGGHTHAETEALMRMRARNELVRRIKDALAVVKNTRAA